MNLGTRAQDFRLKLPDRYFLITPYKKAFSLALCQTEQKWLWKPHPCSGNVKLILGILIERGRDFSRVNSSSRKERWKRCGYYHVIARKCQKPRSGILFAHFSFFLFSLYIDWRLRKTDNRNEIREKIYK